MNRFNAMHRHYKSGHLYEEKHQDYLRSGGCKTRLMQCEEDGKARNRKCFLSSRLSFSSTRLKSVLFMFKEDLLRQEVLKSGKRKLLAQPNTQAEF